MTSVREPAVAGFFYPADPLQLRRDLGRYLATAAPAEAPAPKALIVPHAGYIYSGEVAGRAYALVDPEPVERVVVVGPAHRYPLRGLATHSAESFATPLGLIPVEHVGLPVADEAHAGEHSIEVQLPFLQVVCRRFRVIPILVGAATASEAAAALEAVWGGLETLIVVSSDLSHYHPYAVAQRLDRITAAAITELHPEDIGGEQACGHSAVRGLLTVARRKGLSARLVDLRNSGDTAGERDEVVGYGAFAL
jgi:hypothetical protein